MRVVFICKSHFFLYTIIYNGATGMTPDPDRPRRHRSTLVRPGPSSLNIDTPKSVDLKARTLDQLRARPQGGDNEIVPSSDPEERLQESIDAFVSFILITDLSTLIN